MPDGVRSTPPPAAVTEPRNQEGDDARDLAGFGYRQELKRILGVYSSFAVAFSYISPSTGIFALYALGLGIGGAFFFWSWPLVALGQFLVALNFAEVSSHFPVAGSVYQWSKYLANRHYSWFNGWIYLFAGILTVTAVDLTVPIVLVPFLNGLGLSIPSGFWTPIVVGLLVLLSTTLLNVFGVRLVSIVNNTGVVFEILGMVVFAIYVCCLAIPTSTIRLAFGMARDGKLPLGRIYNRVSPSLHTPVGTCIVIGLLSAIPVFYAGAGTVAISATCMIYLSYFLGNLAILIARGKGWPRTGAPFRLRGWGAVVNVLALVWGGSMLVNFLWPRPGTIINPNTSELPGLAGIPLVGNVPIVELTIGVVVLVGLVYYLIAQVNKPAQPLPQEAAVSA